MHNHLKVILLALTNAGVKYVVGGGVAAVLHGVERVTLDLDVAVEMEPKNLRRFLSVMKAQKLQPRIPVPPEYILNPDNLRVMIDEKHAKVFTFVDYSDPLRSVDFFILPELSYENLRPDAEEVLIGGKTVYLVSKRDLLSLKKQIQPPRPEDLLDIHHLDRLLNGDA